MNGMGNKFSKKKKPYLLYGYPFVPYAILPFQPGVLDSGYPTIQLGVIHGGYDFQERCDSRPHLPCVLLLVGEIRLQRCCLVAHAPQSFHFHLPGRIPWMLVAEQSSEAASRSSHQQQPMQHSLHPHWLNHSSLS